MKITEPGLITDFDTAAYFTDPCPAPSLTQSIAKIIIEQSPAHAFIAHPRLTPPTEDETEKYDKARAIGNAAHALMLRRGKTLAIIDADDFRGKVAQQKRDEATAVGSVPILKKHYETAAGMAASARQQLDAMQLSHCFAVGSAEVVVAWNEGPLWFRSMIDWLSSTQLIFDYKTTGGSASPWQIGAKMAGDGWDIQAAMIERGLDAVDPEFRGRRRFRFVLQENEPPYALTVAELSESTMTIGRKRLQYAIDTWARCITSGEWPGYPRRVIVPDYPAYAESAWLNREIVEYEESRSAQAPKTDAALYDLSGG